VQKLATEANKCTEDVVKSGKRILAYLKGTREQGIIYSPDTERNFKQIYSKIARDEGKEYRDNVAFCDADFAGCTVSLRSTSGSILYHKGCPVMWRSKRQGIRATSTMEAEYCAMYDCIRMTLDQGYLNWFGEQENENFPLIFNDNKSAITLSQTTLPTKRSKHFLLRLHMVKDYMQDLCYVNTHLNCADPLTKPLQGNKYASIFYPTPNSNVEYATACYWNLD
jgi:hypothetical protein